MPIWVFLLIDLDLFTSIIPSIVTSCKLIMQYHDQNIDIDTIHPFCSDFPSLTFTPVCVCVCLFSSLHVYRRCRFLYPSPQLRHRTVPSPQGFLVLPCYNYTSLVSVSVICHSRMFYKWVELYSMWPFGDWLFFCVFFSLSMISFRFIQVVTCFSSSYFSLLSSVPFNVICPFGSYHIEYTS